jgi:hypothetical protein
MRINVTQEDINKGCQNDSGTCPIALALSRATGNAVHVRAIYASVYNWSLLYTTDLPIEARLFIRDFDSGKHVDPFSFELELQDA